MFGSKFLSNVSCCESMRRNARKIGCSMGSIAVLLAGCATNSPLEFREIDGQHSAIRFEHHDFEPKLAEYAVHQDTRTGNELHIATFHGPDSLAVFVASVTTAGYVSEERRAEAVVPDLVAPVAEGAAIIWGETGGASSRLGYTPYRFFRIAEKSLSCAGFSQSVGESHDDRARKANSIYGFFCRDEARPMTPQDTEELIASVAFLR